MMNVNMRLWSHLKRICLSILVISICIRLREVTVTSITGQQHTGLSPELSTVISVTERSRLIQNIPNGNICDTVDWGKRNKSIWNIYWSYVNTTRHFIATNQHQNAAYALRQLHQFWKHTPERPATLSEHSCWMEETCNAETRRYPSPGRLCPCHPPHLSGFIHVDKHQLTRTTWRGLEGLLPGVRVGGHWTPSGCVARRRVAVIVPSRDRETHLRAFLAHMHPLLQKQQLEYRIFIVEQNLPYLFNKAALMNAGYLEVKKMFTAECVLFHDVDTFIESDDNMVMCGDQPIHWAAYSDRFNYIFRSDMYGSGVLFRPDVFERVNGFTNLFFGWGAEDDNLHHRFRQKEMSVYRGPLELGRCTLIGHARDVLFKPDERGFKTKRTMLRDMELDPVWQTIDGLSSLSYDVIAVKELASHTWIHVDLAEPAVDSELPEYTKWVDKIRHIGFLPLPVDYEVSLANCSADGDRGLRHYLSRVSCRSLCQSSESCKLFEYHDSPSTDPNSYCVLRTDPMCDKKSGNHREPVEIHKRRN